MLALRSIALAATIVLASVLAAPIEPAQAEEVGVTFVLVNEHVGRERLFHADLYRIAGAADLSELGLWEEAERGVLVVEWPDRAEGGLPAATLTVDAAAGEVRLDWSPFQGDLT